MKEKLSTHHTYVESNSGEVLKRKACSLVHSGSGDYSSL